MPFPIQVSQEQYEALVALARLGATTPDAQRQLEAFLVDLEKSNGITRYLLLVQWQEADYALPPTVRFPEVWPPELRKKIERIDRPIAKADVDKVLAANAKKPVNVLVTKDPGGTVGWTQIDAFFSVG
jgi:hypothetical protein